MVFIRDLEDFADGNPLPESGTLQQPGLNDLLTEIKTLDSRIEPLYSATGAYWDESQIKAHFNFHTGYEGWLDELGTIIADPMDMVVDAGLNGLVADNTLTINGILRNLGLTSRDQVRDSDDVLALVSYLNDNVGTFDLPIASMLDDKFIGEDMLIYQIGIYKLFDNYRAANGITLKSEVLDGFSVDYIDSDHPSLENDIIIPKSEVGSNIDGTLLPQIGGIGYSPTRSYANQLGWHIYLMLGTKYVEDTGGSYKFKRFVNGVQDGYVKYKDLDIYGSLNLGSSADIGAVGKIHTDPRRTDIYHTSYDLMAARFSDVARERNLDVHKNIDMVKTAFGDQHDPNDTDWKDSVPFVSDLGTTLLNSRGEEVRYFEVDLNLDGSINSFDILVLKNTFSYKEKLDARAGNLVHLKIK